VPGPVLPCRYAYAADTQRSNPHVRSGTPLEAEQAAPAEPRPKVKLLPFLGVRQPETGLYVLQEDCANLQTTDAGDMSCGIYESPERPAICAAFAVGSIGCLLARSRAGIDAPEETELYMQRIAG
jgi:hypothetical protein